MKPNDSMLFVVTPSSISAIQEFSKDSVSLMFALVFAFCIISWEFVPTSEVQYLSTMCAIIGLSFEVLHLTVSKYMQTVIVTDCFSIIAPGVVAAFIMQAELSESSWSIGIYSLTKIFDCQMLQSKVCKGFNESLSRDTFENVIISLYLNSNKPNKVFELLLKTFTKFIIDTIYEPVSFIVSAHHHLLSDWFQAQQAYR